MTALEIIFLSGFLLSMILNFVWMRIAKTWREMSNDWRSLYYRTSGMLEEVLRHEVNRQEKRDAS